ncbi:LuxR C-terminal-related transcriptional regulator [Paenibacillus sp. MBLB4367]|uniref:helix-turn-helix transcriptional regulator n=1 Tax=Paenibacillus sp. MBLB4367 TaxID=3384767 RepID=UPI0039084028
MDDQLSRIQQREDDFLVGREGQLERYLRFLNGEALCGKNVWNVYGTGGLGKSTLIDAFRRMSVQHGGALFLYLDSRDFHHTADELCKKLLQQCGRKDAPAADASNLAEPCLTALQTAAQTAPVTIAFDTYEEMDDLDPWLMEHLIQWLPERILVVIAGRTPLKGKWQLSPAWRERVERFPLVPFDRRQAFAYLRSCGIESAHKQESLWSKSKGHPLALSLAVATDFDNDDWATGSGGDWFDHLVELWLREVPDPQLRQLVEVASTLRQFDYESLSSINGETIPQERFSQLCRLSFVRKAARGWALHDLMREATIKLLKSRLPSHYRHLLTRCASFYVSRILQVPRDGSAVWEMGELFSYIGNATIRWLVSPSVKGHVFWEPLNAGNIEDAERYIHKRYAEARPIQKTETDPATGETLELKMDVLMDLCKLNELPLRSYLQMKEEIVKLLRTTEGEVAGIAAIIPIHSATLPYLLEDPLASPYLKSLSPAEYMELDVPSGRKAGWFIRLIDISDSGDPSLAMEALNLLFTLMVSDGILIASPPPHPVYVKSHLNMGFAEVAGVKHYYYDDVTPTSTFVLDTRGDKLDGLLNRLLQNTGMKETPLPMPETEPEIPAPAAPGKSEITAALTNREKEIVALTLQGLSNLEIASRIFVSEVTVKKHLRSVYEKLQIRNRKELLRLLLTN